MNADLSRRRFLLTALALPGLTLTATAAAPWSYRILSGPKEADIHHFGLHLQMAKGWKTYWRVPGDGGVPPSITLKGTGVKSFEFDCPLPTRFEGADGETIGYKDDVVFPIRLTTDGVIKASDVSIDAFFGLCETVCIPAQVQDRLPEAAAASDADTLQQWQARVPLKSPHGPVGEASFNDGHLHMKLAGPVTEIFVEFLDGVPHYVSRPDIGPGIAKLPVRGLAGSDSLRGRQIRVTSVVGGAGVEQVVSVV